MHNVNSLSNNDILEIDGEKGLRYVTNKLQNSWGEYSIYHIYNVAETDFVLAYENLASELGVIEECRPVNDKSKKASKLK